MPGIGGIAGSDPVAMTTRRVRIVRLPALISRGPTKRASARTTSTPSPAKRSAESCGAIASTTPRTCRRTAVKSTSGDALSTPKRLAVRTACAAFAAASSAFDGTQPVLRHSPPISARSISTVRTPSWAAIAAVVSPAAPAPITQISYPLLSCLPRYRLLRPKRRRPAIGCLFRVQAIGNGAVGADAIRHKIGQQQLCRVERGAADERVSLVDQVQDRADDQRDKHRAPRHPVRYRIMPEPACHDRRRLPGPALLVNTGGLPLPCRRAGIERRRQSTISLRPACPPCAGRRKKSPPQAHRSSPIQ